MLSSKLEQDFSFDEDGDGDGEGDGGFVGIV